MKSLIDSDEINHLRIAIIRGVHGLNGRLKIEVTTGFLGRLLPDSNVLVLRNSAYIPFKIDEFKTYKGSGCLLHLRGIDTRDDAEKYIGHEIFIKMEEAERTRNQLDNGEFYYYDLIGCEVEFKGSSFGIVTAIAEGGGGEILIISDSAGREHLVPFVDEMVDVRSISQKKLTITPVEGLIEDISA